MITYQETAAATAKSLQLCPTLCDPTDGSPPGSSVPGILQARTLEWALQCMKVKRESEVAQSYLTLSDPMDCSLPGSSVHGIFQAGVLEWGVIVTLVFPKFNCWTTGSAILTLILPLDLRFALFSMFKLQLIPHRIFLGSLILFFSTHFLLCRKCPASAENHTAPNPCSFPLTGNHFVHPSQAHLP